MAGVDRAQEGIASERESRQEDSVGTEAHRGLQQALDRHARLALIAFGGDDGRKFFCSGFTRACPRS